MAISSVSSSSLASTPNVSGARGASPEQKSKSIRPQGDSSRMSNPAQLLSKLKQLQESDPTKFKEVLAKLTSTVAEQTKNTTDPEEQKMLSELASRLQQAGRTGDVGALSPNKAKPDDKAAGGVGPTSDGQRPPPNGKVKGAEHAEKSTDAVLKGRVDPADTNKDGTVSLSEQKTYNTQNEKRLERARVAYGASGDEGRSQNMKGLMEKLMSIVDAAAGGVITAGAKAA